MTNEVGTIWWARPLGLTIILAALAGGTGQVTGQTPGRSGRDDELANRPTEYGIRFTPGMARGMARAYITREFTRRYELPEDKTDAATEALSRRLMEAAHSIDTDEQQSAFEEMFAGVMNAQADRQRGGGHGGLPPEQAKAMAKGMKPLLPAIRELIRNAGADLRPMLPLKQQLKLAGDLLSAGAALEAFEATLQRWEKGEVDQEHNPFEDPGKDIKKDEHGESEVLKQSKQAAQNELQQKGWLSQWENYVRQAKEFYKLDDSQRATADSILRETGERADLIVQNDRWQKRFYRNRLWNRLAMSAFRMFGHHPVPHLILRSHQTQMEPIENLGNELKRKIDLIPTQAQKQAADERIEDLLTEQGYNPDEPEEKPKQ